MMWLSASSCETDKSILTSESVLNRGKISSIICGLFLFYNLTTNWPLMLRKSDLVSLYGGTLLRGKIIVQNQSMSELWRKALMCFWETAKSFCHDTRGMFGMLKMHNLTAHLERDWIKTRVLLLSSHCQNSVCDFTSITFRLFNKGLEFSAHFCQLNKNL